MQVLLSFLLMGIKDPPAPSGGVRKGSFSSPSQTLSDMTIRAEGSTEDESMYGGIGPTTLMEDLG